jgi:hypothetical protein
MQPRKPVNAFANKKKEQNLRIYGANEMEHPHAS